MSYLWEGSLNFAAALHNTLEPQCNENGCYKLSVIMKYIRNGIISVKSV